jgi:putative peptidoglycan lipid II flippase
MSKFLKKFQGTTRRVTLGLFIIQLFKAILSFFTVIISSTYFGTSFERDAWLLSLSIIAIVGSITFGPIFEIFRAKFTIIKESNSEELALKHAGSLILYISIITISLIIILEIIPFILSNSFAPNYTLNQTSFLELMIRFFAPTLLLSAITSVLSGILNVYNVYYAPEIMSIVSSIINVIIIILLADKIGIYSLVISNYLTNLLLITVLLFELKKHKIKLFENINLKLKYTYSFFQFAFPFYFNYLSSQIQVAVEKTISTLLEIGSVSVLDYARKFVAIPISMIQTTINSVLTASFASTNINHGEKALLIQVNNFINTAIIITLPIITITTICGEEIVKLFLFRGKFDANFIEPTTNALFWFGLGIISIIFYSTCSQGLLAKGSNKISAFVSGSMGFLILGINFLLYKKYGVQILAFSWSFIHFLSGLIMFLCISLKNKIFILKEIIKKTIFITIILLLSFLIYSIKKEQIFQNSNFNNSFTIALVLFFSVLIELSLIFVMNFEEKYLIIKQFSSLKKQILGK